MARKRNTATLETPTNEEGNDMSGTELDNIFEVMDESEWAEAGAAASAEKGLYGRVLTAFANSGQRFARISTSTGQFAGKQASSVSTALKNARDGKNAPEGVQHVKVSSRTDKETKVGTVYLENPNAA